MRNIFITIIVLAFNFSYAQSPIFSLEGRNPYETVDGAYYKDLFNVLDNFEGTWLYTDGNTSLKIVLVKKPMFFNGDYYEDFMIGEYQYIENGVEKINRLSFLNQNLGYDHKITGNVIHKTCDFLSVDDCVEGEKRLSLGLIDITGEHWARMLLHKRIINGQEAINVLIVFNYVGEENPTPDPTLPWQQEYVMFKQ